MMAGPVITKNLAAIWVWGAVRRHGAYQASGSKIIGGRARFSAKSLRATVVLWALRSVSMEQTSPLRHLRKTSQPTAATTKVVSLSLAAEYAPFSVSLGR